MTHERAEYEIAAKPWPAVDFYARRLAVKWEKRGLPSQVAAAFEEYGLSLGRGPGDEGYSS
jgi:hypothetical protein